MALCYMVHKQHGSMPVSTLKEVDDMKKAGWERVEVDAFIKKMEERRKRIMAEAEKHRSQEEKALAEKQRQEVKDAEARAREETQTMFVDKLKEQYGRLKVNDLKLFVQTYGIEIENNASKDDIITALVAYAIDNDTSE